MITLRRDGERRHVRRGNQDTWLTFDPRVAQESPVNEFRVLTALDEIRFPPGGGSVSHRREEAESVTYVYKGALAQEDSTGNSGVVHAGEFQRMTSGHGIRHKETNASRTGWTHVFRISLRPTAVGLDLAREQKRYAAAQRHNVMCVVAAQDGRRGALRILQDAVIYSSILDPGQHLIHELLRGRRAWLHVIDGEVTLHDSILTQGDGAGVANEAAVSLTAQEITEILLIDLGPPPGVAAGGFRP